MKSLLEAVDIEEAFLPDPDKERIRAPRLRVFTGDLEHYRMHVVPAQIDAALMLAERCGVRTPKQST